MPLPLAIPFLVKGVIVAAKFVATHHAQATVLKGAVVATKTFGAANVAAATGAGLAAVGAGVWTIERLDMAKRAIQLLDAGEPLQAASELTKIARSCYQVDTDSLATTLNHWVESGASPSSPDFESIVSAVRQIVDEAAITSRRA